MKKKNTQKNEKNQFGKAKIVFRVVYTHYNFVKLIYTTRCLISAYKALPFRL